MKRRSCISGVKLKFSCWHLGLTSFFSHSLLQQYTLFLQILEIHLNLLQPPLDGLLPTDSRGKITDHLNTGHAINTVAVLSVQLPQY